MGNDRAPQRPTPATPAAETAERRSDATTADGGGAARVQPPGEIGGPKGPEPTRYGDWEKGGRCTDF